MNANNNRIVKYVKDERSFEKFTVMNNDQAIYTAMKRDHQSYGLISLSLRSNDSDTMSDGMRDQNLPEIWSVIPAGDQQASISIHRIINAVASGHLNPEPTPQRITDQENGLIFWLAPITERAQERMRRLFKPLMSSAYLGEQESDFSVMSLTPERNGVIQARMKADWSVPPPRPDRWPEPTQIPAYEEVLSSWHEQRGEQVPKRISCRRNVDSSCLTLIEFTDTADEMLGTLNREWPDDIIFGCRDSLMSVMASSGHLNLAMPLSDGRLGAGAIVRQVNMDEPVKPESVQTLVEICFLVTGHYPTSKDPDILDVATDHPGLLLTTPPRDEGGPWTIELTEAPTSPLPYRQLQLPDQPLEGRLGTYVERNGWPLPLENWRKNTGA